MPQPLPYTFPFLILLILTSCSTQEEPTFENYNFEIKEFDWDPNPYKFSAFILDSVVQAKGAQSAETSVTIINKANQMRKYSSA